MNGADARRAQPGDAEHFEEPFRCGLLQAFEQRRPVAEGQIAQHVESHRGYPFAQQQVAAERLHQIGLAMSGHDARGGVHGADRKAVLVVQLLERRDLGEGERGGSAVHAGNLAASPSLAFYPGQMPHLPHEGLHLLLRQIYLLSGGVRVQQPRADTHRHLVHVPHLGEEVEREVA